MDDHKHICIDFLLNRFAPLQYVRRYWLKGETLRCNVCENNFSRFLTYGHTERQNAMCPACASLESTRALWFYLTNEVLGKKNKNKFLYVNPEKSVLKRLKDYEITLDTVSLSAVDNKHESKSTALKGGFYDVIIFSHQLEYVKDDIFVLMELRRLLRQGGFILVQTIINPHMDRTYEHIITDEDRDRLNKFFEPGVESIYGENFYKHLSKTGFQVEIIDYADRLGHIARKYYSLGNGDRELIFKCKKL